MKLSGERHPVACLHCSCLLTTPPPPRLVVVPNRDSAQPWHTLALLPHGQHGQHLCWGSLRVGFMELSPTLPVSPVALRYPSTCHNTSAVYRQSVSPGAIHHSRKAAPRGPADGGSPGTAGRVGTAGTDTAGCTQPWHHIATLHWWTPTTLVTHPCVQRCPQGWCQRVECGRCCCQAGSTPPLPHGARIDGRLHRFQSCCRHWRQGEQQSTL